MSEKVGLVKKEHIVDVGEKHYAEASEIVFFEMNDMDNYEQLFLQLRSEGKIIATSFFEYQWKIMYDKKSSSVRFDLSMYPTYDLPLRCFALLSIKTNLDARSTRGKVYIITEMILATQGFSSIEKAEQWLRQKTKSVLIKNVPYIVQFLSFCGEDPELIDLCQQSALWEGQQVRTLPNFKHVLIFDSIINDFFQYRCTEIEKITYYPVFLWWRITMIIPMRVNEFCSIIYNCTSVNQNGEYFLKVPRKKIKAKTIRDVEITDTLQINKELYDQIEHYKEITKEYNHTDFLLSYKAYTEFYVHKNRSNSTNKLNQDRFEYQQLLLLIQHFYKEVVKNNYGYSNLEHLRPLDTRHFAFCNMLFQGFNMLTIARIGGHINLHSQMHYFQHLEYFNESSIQYLSDQYSKLLTISAIDTGSMLEGKERIVRAKSILASISEDEYNSLPKLEYGYCRYNPSKCPVGDCRHCKYFYIPASELSEEVYQWLTDESESLGRRIREQLTLLQSISTTMNYDIVNLKFDSIGQSELSYLATNFRNLREKKAWTDAHRKIIQEYLFGDVKHEETWKTEEVHEGNA